ncbi:MAG: hypothetical protein AAFQ42_02860 [Pseudomonadota bacterium]
MIWVTSLIAGILISLAGAAVGRAIRDELPVPGAPIALMADGGLPAGFLDDLARAVTDLTGRPTHVGSADASTSAVDIAGGELITITARAERLVLSRDCERAQPHQVLDFPLRSVRYDNAVPSRTIRPAAALITLHPGIASRAARAEAVRLLAETMGGDADGLLLRMWQMLAEAEAARAAFPGQPAARLDETPLTAVDSLRSLLDDGMIGGRPLAISTPERINLLALLSSTLMTSQWSAAERVPRALEAYEAAREALAHAATGGRAPRGLRQILRDARDIVCAEEMIAGTTPPTSPPDTPRRVSHSARTPAADRPGALGDAGLDHAFAKDITGKHRSPPNGNLH